MDAAEPLDLWTRLKARCNDTGTGCQALTIPHNSNISNGQMFTVDWGGMPIEEQRAQAALQAELDVLIEIMQAKGDSECRRGMWGVVGGEDEFCDFEKVRYIDGERPPDCEDGAGVGGLRGEGCQSRLDFVRYALIDGLAQEERLGINPFQLGIIASTDGHNGAPGDTDEYDYQGQNANVDSDFEKRLTTPAYAPHRLRNPGGLIGVWAEENSRDSLFDAMLSKETFGTSGVRIKARLFGGWGLPDLCSSNDMIAEAYEQAVPMGGVLPESEGAGAPTLFVSAIADPGASDHPGTPLQRIQIIKGWVGDDGLFHERVFDVAGDPDNGADVSRDSCALSGTGAASLCATWTDPEFDPSRSGRLLRARPGEPELPLERAAMRGAARTGTPGGLRRSRPAVADPGAGLDLTDLVPRQRPATSRPHNEPNPGSAALKSIRSLFATAVGRRAGIYGKPVDRGLPASGPGNAGVSPASGAKRR